MQASCICRLLELSLRSTFLPSPLLDFIRALPNKSPLPISVSWSASKGLQLAMHVDSEKWLSVKRWDSSIGGEFSFDVLAGKSLFGIPSV